MPEGLAYRKDRLCFEKVDLEGVAARFGTPLYVYSEDLVLSRIAQLRRDLAAVEPRLFYALKANPNPALCRLIAREGVGVEVVSGGELFLALQAGFPASHMLFSGVGKTPREIREALRAGVLLINVESEPELRALEQEARKLRKKAPVSLRLNPDIDAGTHRHISTAKAENKFGIPVSEAPALWRFAAKSRHLEPKGLHIHLGSQIRSAAPYARAARTLLELAPRLEKEGARVEYADIGGGLAVPYAGEEPIDTAALARAAAPLARAGLTVLLEPGRFLVAEAGLLLTRVVYDKKTRSRRFAVLDAGMTELIRPALYGARHPILPVRRGKPEVEVEAVGPVCESSDSFGAYRLPEPASGDLWAVLAAGAYGFSMASQYNGRPRPAEVLLSGGKARIVRARETYKDLL